MSKKEKKNGEMENQLEIIYCPNAGNNGGSDQNLSSRSIPSPASVDAPENKLKLFALLLAIMEMTAIGLGKLALVWANVILLGSFSSNLKPIDFCFVSAILVVEGTSLFTCSCELELQHQSTRTLQAKTSPHHIQSDEYTLLRLLGVAMRALSITSPPSRRLAYRMYQLDGLASLSQPDRTRLSADVPLLPYSGWVFISKNISRLLYWLQIFAAAACVALSLMRLGQQDYGDEAQINEKFAINVFYSLALAEALMFLLTMGYWRWRVEHGELFERVSEDCELDPIGMDSLRHFFYSVYSQCIEGNILDGLKMDFVSFAVELLNRDSPDEQIIGLRILQQFIKNPRFAADTIRKIGSSTPVIERLIEMLAWEDPTKEDIRLSASEIVSKLASKRHQALLVAAIPGAIKSIASLLHTGGGSADGRPHEASPTAVMDRESYRFSTFNQIGLLILKRLARYPNNGLKIGNEQGLLARIIDLTNARVVLLCDEHAIKTVRRALQVVTILVGATGETGTILRRDISEIAHLRSNINRILNYGQSHLQLQILGLQILTNLAMKEKERKDFLLEGSMLMSIFGAFSRPIVSEEVGEVCNKAGEALVVLLKHWMNCDRMLREGGDVVKRLVDALSDPALRVNALRILRCLCAHITSFSRSSRWGVEDIARNTFSAAIEFGPVKLSRGYKVNVSTLVDIARGRLLDEN